MPSFEGNKAAALTDTAADVQAQKHPNVLQQATQTPVLLPAPLTKHSLAKAYLPTSHNMSTGLNRHGLNNMAQSLAISAQQAQDCAQLQTALVSPSVMTIVAM